MRLAGTTVPEGRGQGQWGPVTSVRVVRRTGAPRVRVAHTGGRLDATSDLRYDERMATLPELSSAAADLVRARVRDVPDFPKPGILFKDLTPVLGHGPTFAAITEAFVARYRGAGIVQVAVIEARGFAVGAPIAYALGAGLTLLRKPNKLPAKKRRMTYALEYGTDALEIHEDALTPGDRVLVIDDVLATGGTLRAAVDLVREVGADVVEAAVVIELSFLGGRARVGAPTAALVTY